MTEPIVFYHGGCSDGFGAAWAAKRSNTISSLATYVPFVYGRRHDAIQNADRDLYYFLDCSPTIDDYDRLTQSFGRTIIVIDHHETALKNLQGKPNVHLDMTRSGAVLSWKYFRPNQDIPPILRYVQDRDLWHHDLPDTYAINAYINAQQFNYEVWDNVNHMLEYDRDKVVSLGGAVQDFQNREIEKLLSKVHTRELLGQPVLCVNTSTLPSELCHAILDKYPTCDVAGSYWTDGNIEFWSLRSRTGGVNVATLSEKFGGGGHPSSAGFRRLPNGKA